MLQQVHCPSVSAAHATNQSCILHARDKQFKRRVFYSERPLALLQPGALGPQSKEISYEERHHCHNSQVRHSKISVLQHRLLHLRAALCALKPHHIQPLLYLRLVILHLRWQVAQIVPRIEPAGNSTSLSLPASDLGFLSVNRFPGVRMGLADCEAIALVEWEACLGKLVSEPVAFPRHLCHFAVRVSRRANRRVLLSSRCPSQIRAVFLESVLQATSNHALSAQDDDLAASDDDGSHSMPSSCIAVAMAIHRCSMAPHLHWRRVLLHTLWHWARRLGRPHKHHPQLALLDVLACGGLEQLWHHVRHLPADLEALDQELVLTVGQ